jgi:alanine racemase
MARLQKMVRVPRMKVRLAEIAERAGVSIATVSRVLNDKPGVHDRTRQAVLTAVDVLGYDRPSRLRPRMTGLVGLIVPELENPIFPRFAQLVETTLARSGYTPLLCTQSPGGIHEDDYVETLLARGVSGIIFVSGLHANTRTDPQRYHRLHALGMPMVLVNGYVEGLDVPFVSADDELASDLAVAHLAHMGHTRIGLATGQRRYFPVVRRMQGFRDAMRRHVDPDLDDEALDDLVETTYFTIEGGSMAAHALLDRGVTAVVCGSDLMALGVIRAARQRGLEVPAGLSVVGSDDSLLVAFTDPPLTTVRQPVQAMADATARALLDQIEGMAPPSTELLFAPELVVRGSTARVHG